MVIIWRDVDLKTHVIKLERAIDVNINGIELEMTKKGISARVTDKFISVRPVSSNYIIIEKV